MKGKILIGVAALLASCFAFASGDVFVAPAPTFMPGVYLGAQGGYGMSGWNNVDSGSNFSDVTGANAFAGRAFLGYDFHPNFAIEAGYTQFFNDTKLKNLMVGKTYNPKYNYAIDLVGKIKAHIIQQFGLYTKVGVDYIATNEGLDGDHHYAVNVIYGAGAYYDFTPNFMADLSWTRYNGKAKWANDYIPAADLFAAGIAYKFNLA